MLRKIGKCIAVFSFAIMVSNAFGPPLVTAQASVRVIPVRGILPGFALAPGGDVAAVYESALLYPQLEMLGLSELDVNLPLRLVDLESGEVLAEFAGFTDLITGVAFSPDGSLLASHHMNGYINLWDVEREELRDVIPFLPALESFIRFLPDGETLVVVDGQDSILEIFLVDIETGYFTAILTYRFDIFEELTDAVSVSPERLDLIVQDLVVLPDGTALVTAGGNGSLWRWDLATGQPTLIREGDDVVSLSVETLRILPDGRTLVFFNRQTDSIRFWDLETRSETRVIESVEAGYALSPDGETLAWFDPQDGVMTFVNLSAPETSYHVDIPPQAGVMLGVMVGREQTGLAFTPDGEHLVMAGGMAFPDTATNVLYVIDVP